MELAVFPGPPIGIGAFPPQRRGFLLSAAAARYCGVMCAGSRQQTALSRGSKDEAPTNRAKPKRRALCLRNFRTGRSQGTRPAGESSSVTRPPPRPHPLRQLWGRARSPGPCAGASYMLRTDDDATRPTHRTSAQRDHRHDAGNELYGHLPQT